jgi:hypothetical protein
VVGHFLWPEVQFHGPDGNRPCELPEGQQGQVEQVFINGSIYPQTFTTTAMTRPAALTFVGAASRPQCR